MAAVGSAAVHHDADQLVLVVGSGLLQLLQELFFDVGVRFTGLCVLLRSLLCLFLRVQILLGVLDKVDFLMELVVIV